MTHSLVSGKKEIYEDGTLIISMATLAISEFAHGWTSNGFIFRIESQFGLSKEHTYIFSIDGN